MAEHDAQQDQTELGVLLAYLAAEIGPRHVLEIGGAAGGSAWAFAQLPTVEHVVTVDLPNGPWPMRDLGLGQRHTVIWADSTEAETIARIAALYREVRPQLVFIDGGHEETTARSDWAAYGPLADAGGLVVLHDINDYPVWPQVQVHRLWAEVRTQRPTLEIVADRGGPAGTGIVWA